MELFFEGLCAFVAVDRGWEVWMGAGGMTGQMMHLPTLMVPSLSLDLDQSTLAPEGIGFVPIGRRNVFGRIWLLNGRTLEVVTTDNQPTQWLGNDRELVLDLPKIHGSPLNPMAPKGTSIIKLKGGTLSVHRTGKFKVKVPQKPDDPRDCADVVKWTGTGYLQDDNMHRIQFDDEHEFGTVCNSAPDRGGAKHFQGFYDFTRVPKADRISVEAVRSPKANVSEGENCSPNSIL